MIWKRDKDGKAYIAGGAFEKKNRKIRALQHANKHLRGVIRDLGMALTKEKKKVKIWRDKGRPLQKLYYANARIAKLKKELSQRKRRKTKIKKHYPWTPLS